MFKIKTYSNNYVYDSKEPLIKTAAAGDGWVEKVKDHDDFEEMKTRYEALGNDWKGFVDRWYNQNERYHRWLNDNDLAAPIELAETWTAASTDGFDNSSYRGYGQWYNDFQSDPNKNPKHPKHFGSRDSIAYITSPPSASTETGGAETGGTEAGETETGETETGGTGTTEPVTESTVIESLRNKDAWEVIDVDGGGQGRHIKAKQKAMKQPTLPGGYWVAIRASDDSVRVMTNIWVDIGSGPKPYWGGDTSGSWQTEADGLIKPDPWPGRELFPSREVLAGWFDGSDAEEPTWPGGSPLDPENQAHDMLSMASNKQKASIKMQLTRLSDSLRRKGYIKNSNALRDIINKVV